MDANFVLDSFTPSPTCDQQKLLKKNIPPFELDKLFFLFVGPLPGWKPPNHLRGRGGEINFGDGELPTPQDVGKVSRPIWQQKSWQFHGASPTPPNPKLGRIWRSSGGGVYIYMPTLAANITLVEQWKWGVEGLMRFDPCCFFISQKAVLVCNTFGPVSYPIPLLRRMIWPFQGGKSLLPRGCCTKKGQLASEYAGPPQGRFTKRFSICSF